MNRMDDVSNRSVHRMFGTSKKGEVMKVVWPIGEDSVRMRW